MTDANQPVTWECGLAAPAPGIEVQLSAGRSHLGIKCGSEDNAVVMPADRARAVASALLEASNAIGTGSDQDAWLILGDLDRCPHGRHAADSCFDCPSGRSAGNVHLTPGTVIGHGYDGREIVIPDPEGRFDPAAWRRT